jgi:hypothetical protein
VTAGESVTYHATAEDAYGNTWDVTAGTAFSIEAGAGGSWADNVYTSNTAGTWTVTGEYEGLTDTAILHVQPAPAPQLYTIYLPIIVTKHPDLVVQRIIATSNNVQVVIKNQGASFTPHHSPPFPYVRIDLYVNPNPVPTEVNQTWDDGRCTQGAVWSVPTTVLIRSNKAITLTIGDVYYQPSFSSFPESLPAGTPIYAQVDSLNPDTTYGAVLEDHETTGGVYNNITGPVLSTPSNLE